MNDLTESLSFNLPKGSYKLLHIQSEPRQCKHLLVYHKKSAHKPNLTILVKHFINLIHDDLIIMGIEIYVYLTVFESHINHHIFISKADTTGLSSHKYKFGPLISSIVKFFIEYDVNNYCKNVKLKTQDVTKGSGTNRTVKELNRIIERLREGPAYYKSIPYYNDVVIPIPRTDLKTLSPPQRIRTCISLFTRASEQYLFPNSSKNKGKHVIGGAGLLNWWIKLLNVTLQSQEKGDPWECRLHVPGSDEVSISKMLPACDSRVKWSIGSIFDTDTEKLAINQIPLFPDDPKGRFLEHLIVENRYKSTNLRQFWQELGFRQEFRLGNVVGIIGCEQEEREMPSPDNNELCVLPLSQYKKILSSMKTEDYSNPEDIRSLVSGKIPDLMKEFSAVNYYIPFEGSKETPIQPTVSIQPTNDLNVAVMSKSEAKREVNDLSASIKRKRPNDLSGLVRKKPTSAAPDSKPPPQDQPPKVNVINGLIRKKPKK